MSWALLMHLLKAKEFHLLKLRYPFLLLSTKAFQSKNPAMARTVGHRRPPSADGRGHAASGGG